MKRRDYVGVSYGGPRSMGRGAARLARYIGDREGAKTFGDRAAFLEAAKERAVEGRRASYAHAIVSPERGERFENGDLRRLVEPFLKDRDGTECPYFGAIHRDTDHPHVHVAVARDKFEKRELEGLKGEVRDLAAIRERLREPPWHEGFMEREERALLAGRTIHERGLPELERGPRGADEWEHENEREQEREQER